MNEEKKVMKKPMDFDELREFAVKFEQDRQKIQNDKKDDRDDLEQKNKKVADFYEQLLSKFPKK